MRGRNPRRIVLAVTSAQSLRLLVGFPQHLAERGWDVHVVCDEAPVASSGAVTYHALAMRRDPSPFSDLVSLLRWVVLLMRLRPVVVSAGTPKAGLLGVLAGYLTRVPVRVYMLRGLRLSTESGRRRQLLSVLERGAAAASTRILSVSASLREEFVGERLAAREKVTVLGAGSSNGVLIRSVVRDERSDKDFTVGFVGRLHPDKGVDVLVQAAALARTRCPELKLLLIGGEEPVGSLAPVLAEAAAGDRAWITTTGHVSDPETYYPRMDVLVLMTRREGFPNVVLEAAAHGVPAIASRVTGCVDAVVDGETGILLDGRDAASLAEALVQACRAGIRDTLGPRARARVQHLFAREQVWTAHEDFYELQLDGLESVGR